MKQKFKFKAIDYRGKVVFFTKEYDCPTFTVIPSRKWNEVDLPETSVETQLMDWLDGQDKSTLMIEKDLGVIINYWIPEKKQAKVKMIDVLKQLDMSEQQVLDFMAVYAEIKPLLKGKSITAQFKIIFSHMGIGYTAASNAYTRIGDILKAGTSDKERELMGHSPQVLGVGFDRNNIH